jgi:hypothetical protein
MSRIRLVGVDGSNPLGFLAALGLLRVVPGAKLGFSEDGSFRAFVDGLDKSESDLATLIAADAEAAANASAPWRFTYTKAATKKQGPQEVADLKPPPEDFKRFLTTCIETWLAGNDEAAGYAAAYGTDIAVDGKGNTKPSAFHFTAAQQTFLGAVEDIRASVTQEWVETSLFKGHGERPGSNLRWDPGAERNWALMASNPNSDGTRVDAPLEWLAFRALPLLPSFPRGARIITTGVVGRGDDMTFTWPLWSLPASLLMARSALQVDWTGSTNERAARGVFAICSSAIRRTSQGFGNFGPSSVIS